MIIITGATGQLGSRVVEQLLRRVPAERVGVSVRDPGKAGDLGGARVRRGDFADPGSLAEAFEGASQVLVVSAAVTGEEALALHRTAIEAATKAGARRVLYTSHQGAADDSVFAPMPDHAATERILSKTAPSYTSLRNGFYATTVPWLLGRALETGELLAPQDGPVSWTSHDDLAEATAIILADEGRFDGPTPPLTGPAALDFADVARELSEMTGRSIRRVVVDDEEYGAALNLPAERTAMMLGMFRASRRGEFATVTPDLAQILGRPATPLRDLLAKLL
ncbi:SDR family oxidoreductase [Dactylosporangium salmoneum]|uniref:NAD(P)H-binding protein n=1 Tax=Dactylosporangium salmoneum TaxID=53361 RepID=A0ABP5SRF8_9ACTN